MPEPSTSPQVSQTLGGSGLDPDTATVAGLRQALTEGTITAGELTAFYLSRIERLNPALGAVITVSPDAAADARASDESRAGGAAPGVLDGIPVLIRDNIAVRGMPATAGSPALAEADQDEAFLVTRLREAGPDPGRPPRRGPARRPGASRSGPGTARSIDPATAPPSRPN